MVLISPSAKGPLDPCTIRERLHVSGALGARRKYSCGACEGIAGTRFPLQTLGETHSRTAVVSTHGAMVSARRKPTLEAVHVASVKTGNTSQDRSMGAG